MNKDEIIQMMEEKGYEERLTGHTISIDYEGKTYYFKEKQKFPIVFQKESGFRIEVQYDGAIKIFTDCVDGLFISDSLPLLEQALQKSKEIRGLK